MSIEPVERAQDRSDYNRTQELKRQYEQESSDTAGDGIIETLWVSSRENYSNRVQTVVPRVGKLGTKRGRKAALSANISIIPSFIFVANSSAKSFQSMFGSGCRIVTQQSLTDWTRVSRFPGVIMRCQAIGPDVSTFSYVISVRLRCGIYYLRPNSTRLDRAAPESRHSLQLIENFACGLNSRKDRVTSTCCVVAQRQGVGLAIYRSRCSIPIRWLSRNIGQLSLAFLRSR